MNGEHVQTTREVSTSEASRLSGLSQGYITSLVRKGKLDGRRHGIRWIVYQDSLDAYLGSEAPLDRQYRYAYHLLSRASQTFGQGKYTEAALLYQEAIMRYDQWPNLGAYEGAVARNNLASIYLEEHRYSEAEALLTQALTTAQRRPDLSYALLVAVLTHLIAVYSIRK